MLHKTTSSRLSTNISIETLDDTATPLFKNGDEVPAMRARKFGTGFDDQASIELHLVQGNSPVASENITFGKWQICGFPPGAPKDTNVAEAFFRIEADGLFTIDAVLNGQNMGVRLISEGIPRVELV